MESAEGFNIAAILQNAGSCLNSVFCCAAPCNEGNENSPAATDCAEVIVVCSRDSDFRLSHVAAYAKADVVIKIDARQMRIASRLFITVSRWLAT